MDALDIIGYNYIDRLYGTNTYVPEHARFPHRLCLAPRPRPQIHYWLGVRDNDYVIGEFIWTGIDYLGETGDFPAGATVPVSLTSLEGKRPGSICAPPTGATIPCCRSRSRRREARAAIGDRGPSLTKWNGPEGAQLTVRAVTNCDEVELFLNGRSLGRHAISRDVYSSDWSVPTLRECSRRSVIAPATGAAQNCHDRRGGAAPDHAAPIAHLQRYRLYEITVVDEAGLTVHDATPAVTVHVEGAAASSASTPGTSAMTVCSRPTPASYQGRLLATVQRTAPRGRSALPPPRRDCQPPKKRQ